VGQEVAIVGMACLFPGAGDLGTFARNIKAGVDAIGDVPAGRWDPVFFDPESSAPDRFYCKRGGFVDELARFDAPAHGVMPVAARTAEPDQLLTLEIATRALADAGLDRRDFDRRRAGVIVGRGNYAGAGRTRLELFVRGAEQLVRSLRQLVPGITESQLAAVKKDFQAQVGAAGPDGAIGLVPNLTASRIANRLDLGGPAYTIDAACASALVAVDQAVTELGAGRLDVVIAGGVHFCHDEAFWSVFCQLGALSRAQAIRPFDRRADGILIGEGAGLLVLRRRADAERDGDRIYAVIRGTGVASDGRAASLMSPAVEGQVAALERAWRDAELDPTTVGLIEAHGTATPAGDASELETLRRVFGGVAPGGSRAALGSVKSMIGHAMPAAGAAGLIKAALALHQRTLFPSLHCEEPHEALGRTRFRVLGESEPWPVAAGAPRRAAVNAFGFGGIDAHVVLEEVSAERGARVRVTAPPASTSPGVAPAASRAAASRAAASPAARTAPVPTAPASPASPVPTAPISSADAQTPPRPAVAGGASAPSGASTTSGASVASAAPSSLLIAGADAAEVLRRLDAPPAGALGVARAGDGPCRLAILHPTPERLAKARAIVEKGRPWRGRDGVWFIPRGLAADGGRVAFLYPGVDAALRPRLHDVAIRFGWTLPPEIGEGVTSIEHQGLTLVESGRLFTHALAELGIRPDCAIGHSVGEWSAMVASGMLAYDEAAPFIQSARTNVLEVPGVAFLALGCGVDKAVPALAGLPDIAVSHDNCPHQVILCGVDASIDEALRRLRAAGVLGQKLPFRSGFHSPLFAGHIEPHRKNFASITLRPTQFPVWSATTCAPYPTDPDEIRHLSVRHLLEPVRFRELVRKLYGEGVRLFVQVGPGSALNFIEDILRGEPVAAVPCNVHDRTGIEQLWRAGLALWSEGLEVRLERLVPNEGQSERSGGERAASARAPGPMPTAASPPAPARPALTLALGVPLVGFARPLELAGVQVPDQPLPPGPLAKAFSTLLADVKQAGSEIIAQLGAPARPGPATRRVVRRMSPETHPWLLDHTFFRQAPGWPSVADRHPVVPMTTSIKFMMDEAQAAAPGLVPIAVEDVRAWRWLAVNKVTDVNVVAAFDGQSRVKVTLDDYAEATVIVAPAYPQNRPAVPSPPPGPQSRPSPIDAHTLYAERWMFHGPQYQCITHLGPVWDAGISGVIETGAAPGSLLDNAGQILGFWVMQDQEKDRFAMPVGVERLRFFGPHPAPGEKVSCDVRIRLMDAQRVVADLVLSVAGQTWCAIEGWEDRRFTTDTRLWNALVWPEKNPLAQPYGPVWMFRDIYRSAPTREQLYRRYLCERERADHDAQPPRGQRAHLAGRIAAKDAVRALLAQGGPLGRFPAEVQLTTLPSGQPKVTAPVGVDVRVSIAHKGDVAVAMAALGRDVGVDVELIEPRPAGFAEVAFQVNELALIRPSEDRDEWFTRLWTAKEAVGKLLGTGLDGNPRRFEVTDRTGERLLCRGIWVETRKDGDYVIAWTDAP
jgi:acyl transferase domain-containing protein/phosphopantetheinyl transferase